MPEAFSGLKSTSLVPWTVILLGMVIHDLGKQREMYYKLASFGRFSDRSGSKVVVCKPENAPRTGETLVLQASREEKSMSWREGRRSFRKREGVGLLKVLPVHCKGLGKSLRE